MTSMTIQTRVLQVGFAGVDTHKDTHHVAVVDAEGGVLADRQFTTSNAGTEALIGWLGQWAIERVGVEQSGTYGSGLCVALLQAGYQVFDVNTPDLTVRAGRGKSDPIDAVMAAHAVRTGRATTIAKDRRGVIESIRFLQIARSSAVKARSAALTQIGSLAVVAPAELRERLGASNRQITAASLRLRPDKTHLSDPTQATKLALRSIAQRIEALDAEIKTLDTELAVLVESVAPRLLERPQVGVQAAAQLLITAGQNPDRIGTDAAFARLTGVAPIPASSGKTNRMRLHRGGDRQANKVIHMIAVGRLRNYQPAIDYLARRTTDGLSKKDAIRAMKRLIARELHGALKADLTALDGL